MKVKKIPPTYATSDGKEWASEAEALRHQTLLDAHQNFVIAEKQWHYALAESQVTADGVPFQFGIRDYYFVSWWSSGRPSLITVDFIGRNTSWDGENLRLIPYGANLSKVNPIDIADLYYHKKNAQYELIKRLNEFVTERQEEIRKLREEVK